MTEASNPRIDLYKRLLLKWTEKVNLIGPEARKNLDEHVQEALAAAEILKPAGEVLDFGSGGGLPAWSAGRSVPVSRRVTAPTLALCPWYSPAS